MHNLNDPRHDLASFTEGPVSDPEPSPRHRPLTPFELSIVAGPVTVPLNDPIRPERIVKALLTIAGTRHNLDAHDRAVAQLCWFHTRNGDGS